MDEIVSESQFSGTEFRLIIGTTGIEYDPNKEEANRKKHGYSLESAVFILERAILPLGHPPLFTSDPIERNGEIRHNHLAVDDQKKVVFIATTMRPNEKVRVISFRTAHENERLLYWDSTGEMWTGMESL